MVFSFFRISTTWCFPKYHSSTSVNVTTNPKLVSGKTGSVTTSSSPHVTNSLRGLSKFTRVAFSNAGGFLMYRVFIEEVTLGAFRRNSPSHSCCRREFRVVHDGSEI